jgi:hypothetical protein
MPAMVQDWYMTYFEEANMGAERADAWKRAEMLVNEGKNTDDPYTIKDGKVTGDATTSGHRKGIDSLGSGMAPQMGEEAAMMDDDDVRERLGKLSDAQIGALPLSERMRMLFALMEGYTGNADEALLLRILNSSKTDMVTLIDAAGVWTMVMVSDGDDYASLRLVLKASYYAKTASTTVGGLIKKCADGETANWEESMIIDILQAWEGNAGIVRVVEMTGAEAILDNVDGANYTEAKRILSASYYPLMSEDKATAVILSALDEVSTEEYQEEMIIDILEAHPARRAIVINIGKTVSSNTIQDSEHFKLGLKKLHGTLDGNEDDRLAALFGS